MNEQNSPEKDKSENKNGWTPIQPAGGEWKEVQPPPKTQWKEIQPAKSEWTKVPPVSGGKE